MQSSSYSDTPLFGDWPADLQPTWYWRGVSVCSNILMRTNIALEKAYKTSHDDVASTTKNFGTEPKNHVTICEQFTAHYICSWRIPLSIAAQSTNTSCPTALVASRFRMKAPVCSVLSSLLQIMIQYTSLISSFDYIHCTASWCLIMMVWRA